MSNLSVISLYKCVLECEKTTGIYLVDISSFVNKFIANFESTSLIVVKEGGSSLLIGKVQSHVQIDELLTHRYFIRGNWRHSDPATLCLIVEWSDLLVVSSIRIDFSFYEEVDQALVRTVHRKVECISQA